MSEGTPLCLPSSVCNHYSITSRCQADCEGHISLNNTDNTEGDTYGLIHVCFSDIRNTFNFYNSSCESKYMQNKSQHIWIIEIHTIIIYDSDSMGGDVAKKIVAIDNLKCESHLPIFVNNSIIKKRDILTDLSTHSSRCWQLKGVDILCCSEINETR